MPDAKYDDKLSCYDHDVMGEPCPFHVSGKCHFFSKEVALDLPHGGVCDKTPDPLSPRTIIIFGIDQEEIKKIRSSQHYRQWLNAFEHYQLPKAIRHPKEVETLWERYLGRFGDISRREFKKKFKPKELGVGPEEAPSFRMRVLTEMRWSKGSIFHSLEDSLTGDRSASGTEKVAILPKWTIERYRGRDNSEELYEYWDIKVLTRRCFFKDELDCGGIEGFEDTDLEKICQEHEGKKLLLEVHWWYSPGSYLDGPGDADAGIDRVKLLRVLDG